MFNNECLGEMDYEATTAAIVMAGLFVSFMTEYVVLRALRWHQEKRRDHHASAATSSNTASPELINVSIMEIGIVFHSVRK
jgi:solute carrier family 39 (zinc transporter), member 1/2/3